MEPPLPNIRFKTHCDGIFYTPVNHAIGSIDSAGRPSVQLDDKAAHGLPGAMLSEQYCSLLKPRLISRGDVLRPRGIAGPCSSQWVAVAPSKRCARVQWIVANRHDAAPFVAQCDGVL